MGETTKKHLTGDYYWNDTTDDWIWIAGGILAIVLPPVGLFILGYLVFDSITSNPGA